MVQVKRHVSFPIFNSPEEMIRAMAAQRDFYTQKRAEPASRNRPPDIHGSSAKSWLETHQGILGEESLELLETYGIPVAESRVAKNAAEAADTAGKLGYPVAMKVVSPDALHKSEVQGVRLGIKGDEDATSAFQSIEKSLCVEKPGARFEGVRVQKMAPQGYDMFVGGKHDAGFGPVVFFGLGGIYVETFKDVAVALCPSSYEEIHDKLMMLRSYLMLKGARGKQKGDIEGYIDIILRVSYLMADSSRIKELDLNPVRILTDGSGVLALDARANIAKSDSHA